MYVFNDAIFSPEDWRGIISPRVGSNKKDCPEKVGKFGLGFSSVYHITGKLTDPMCSFLCFIMFAWSGEHKYILKLNIFRLSLGAVREPDENDGSSASSYQKGF